MTMSDMVKKLSNSIETFDGRLILETNELTSEKKFLNLSYSLFLERMVEKNIPIPLHLMDGGTHDYVSIDIGTGTTQIIW